MPTNKNFLLLCFFIVTGFMSNIIFQLVHQRYRDLNLMDRIYSETIYDIIPGNAISDDIVWTILFFFVLVPLLLLLIISAVLKIYNQIK